MGKSMYTKMPVDISAFNGRETHFQSLCEICEHVYLLEKYEFSRNRERL